MGVYNDRDGITLRHGKDYQLKKEDQIIILVEDDSTIDFVSNPVFDFNEIPIVNSRLPQEKKKILILGWHSVAKVFY